MLSQFTSKTASLEHRVQEANLSFKGTRAAKGVILEKQWLHSPLAGLGKLSLHKLRHSHAGALVEGGRSINEVKELLRHSSIATTQIYVHASRVRLEAAVASLPDMLDVAW